MSGLLGQVALASVKDDRLVADDVAHHDGVGDVVGQRAVAAVGDRPFGAADGGGAVAAAGAEFPVGAGVQELNASKPGTVPAFPLEIRVR